MNRTYEMELSKIVAWLEALYFSASTPEQHRVSYAAEAHRLGSNLAQSHFGANRRD